MFEFSIFNDKNKDTVSKEQYIELEKKKEYFQHLYYRAQQDTTDMRELVNLLANRHKLSLKKKTLKGVLEKERILRSEEESYKILLNRWERLQHDVRLVYNSDMELVEIISGDYMVVIVGDSFIVSKSSTDINSLEGFRVLPLEKNSKHTVMQFEKYLTELFNVIEKDKNEN
jgi:hypothetical protein